MVLIFPPEPSKECVKVCHVIFECRVINHHPKPEECVFITKLPYLRTPQVCSKLLTKLCPCLRNASYGCSRRFPMLELELSVRSRRGEWEPPRR